MAYTYLMTDGEFKQFVSWSMQIDTNWIKSGMRLAQDLYIEPLLTQDLYNELVNQVSTNTVTTENEMLLDNLKPCLAWRIAQCSVADQAARVANIGVVANSGQNEQPSDEWANRRIMAQSNAESYEAKLRKFLDKNHDDYPLWPYNHCGDVSGSSGGDSGIAYPSYIRRRVNAFNRSRDRRN